MNILEGIWSYYNTDFDVLWTKNAFNWFIIFGFCFVINIFTTSVCCLLDAYKWNPILKVMLPFAVALYLLHSAYYWHFQDESNTSITIKLFGYSKAFYVDELSANADINAAVFFLNQAWLAFRYPTKTKWLTEQCELVWLPKKYKNKGIKPGDRVIVN